MRPKTKSTRPKPRKNQGPCPFCQGKSTPDYKDPKTLKPLLTPRGKIAARDNTGVCAKHQRRLAQAIKRARHLALLPFVSSI